MRIVKYSAEIGLDKRTILVKEESKNYPGINKLDSPQKIADMFRSIYHADKKAEEYVWIIALDTKNKPIGIFEMSHGTVNSSLISPREIFVRLCLCGATYCILVHNHPSGDVTPSKEDVKVTERIKAAGEIMNISLLDHIIIGDCYYSFRKNNHVI